MNVNEYFILFKHVSTSSLLIFSMRTGLWLKNNSFVIFFIVKFPLNVVVQKYEDSRNLFSNTLDCSPGTRHFKA